MLVTSPLAPHEYGLIVLLCIAVGTSVLALLAWRRCAMRNRYLQCALSSLREQERSQLARTLHDDLGQYLTAMRVQAFMLQQLCGDGAAAQQSERLLETCAGLQQGFRLLLRDLHPLELEQQGLQQGLQRLVDHWQSSQGIDCRLMLDDALPAMPAEQRMQVFRLAQEALNNVARHAGARRVWVSLRCHAGALRLKVRDDGCGLAAGGARANGLGMASMQQRADSLQAALSIRSRPGAGLTLSLDIPLEVMAA